MSDREPTAVYVYQPDPPDPASPLPAAEQRIWGVSGPRADEYAGRRFTRSEAAGLALRLNAAAEIRALHGPGGRRCPKCGGPVTHGRLFGYRCANPACPGR